MSYTLSPSGSVTLTTDSDQPLDHPQAIVLLKSFEPRFFFSRDHLDPNKRMRKREGLLDLCVGGQATTLRWHTDKEGALPEKVVRKLVGRPLFIGPVDGVLSFSAQVIESDKKTRAALGKAADVLGAAASVAALIPVAGAVAAAGTGLARAVMSSIRGMVDDDSELIFEGAAFDDPPGEGSTPLRQGTYRLVRRRGDSEDIALELVLHGFTPPLQAEGAKRRATVVVRSIDLEPPLAKHPPAESRRLRGRSVLIEAVTGGHKSAQTASLHLPARNGAAFFDEFVGVNHRILYRGPFAEGMPLSITSALLARTWAEEVQAMAEAVAGIVNAATEQDLAWIGENVGGVAQSARGVVLELLPDWEEGSDPGEAKRSMLSATRLLWTHEPPALGFALQRMTHIPFGGQWWSFSLGDLEKDGVVLHLAIKIEDVDP